MMPRVDGSLPGSGYGASEVIQYYQKYMSRSLALSIVLQIAFVTPFYIFRVPEQPIESPRKAELVPYRSLIPPSLFQADIASLLVRGTKSVASPKFAIPIPVVDPLVDSNNTIPSRQQPWASFGKYADGAVLGTFGDQPIEPYDDEAEPPPFRPIEKLPEIVKRVEPAYPEAAVRAEIEGTVILNVWVDATGRVRQAVVTKSDEEILNSAAIEAVRQWVFTPAIMHHGPVSVWVSIPFKFRLHRK